MNEHAGNEGMLAEKLNHLPVPDLQDAVWGRVSGMLDATPTDQGLTSGAGTANFSLYKIMIWAIAGVTIAALGIILIERNTGKVKELKQIPPIHENARQDTAAMVPVPKESINKSASPRNNSTSIVSDSVEAPMLQPRIPTARDGQTGGRSIQNTFKLPDSISLRPADTIARFDIPRGVKNISDSGYRILPGKKN